MAAKVQGQNVKWPTVQDADRRRRRRGGGGARRRPPSAEGRRRRRQAAARRTRGRDPRHDARRRDCGGVPAESSTEQRRLRRPRARRARRRRSVVLAELGGAAARRGRGARPTDARGSSTPIRTPMSHSRSRRRRRTGTSPSNDREDVVRRHDLSRQPQPRARVEDEGARLDLARVVLAELDAGGEVGEAGGRAGARLVHRCDVRSPPTNLSQF